MLNLPKITLFVIFILFSVTVFTSISVEFVVKGIIDSDDKGVIDSLISSVRSNLGDTGVLFTPPYSSVVKLQFGKQLQNITLDIYIDDSKFFSKSFDKNNFKEIAYIAYLNIAEALSLSYYLKNNGEEIRLTYYDSVNEYPGVYEDNLIFISDRMTGNTNIFFRNMKSLDIHMIEIPLTAEVFPLITDKYFYFLKVDIGSSKVNRISNNEKNSYIQLVYSGNVTCMKIHKNDLFISDKNKILKFNSSKNEWNVVFQMDEKIQSFDLNENFLYISFLNDNQYDIKKINLNTWVSENITSTSFSEIDLSVSTENGNLVFSSNKSGNFNIYLLDENTAQITRITNNYFDEFYPFFYNKNKVIFSRYEEDLEPYLMGVSL